MTQKFEGVLDCIPCYASGNCPGCKGSGEGRGEESKCSKCEGTGKCIVCKGRGLNLAPGYVLHHQGETYMAKPFRESLRNLLAEGSFLMCRIEDLDTVVRGLKKDEDRYKPPPEGLTVEKWEKLKTRGAKPGQ